MLVYVVQWVEIPTKPTMLSNTLVTNEIRNKAGAEVEFNRLSLTDQKTVYAASTELPNSPHRLTISHEESGKGFNLRRRTSVRFDKTHDAAGTEAPQQTRTSVYMVLDTPIGAVINYDETLNLIAELVSFMAGNGTADLLKYDGTGTGTAAVINGGL